jgi:predicted DNA-binding transcriptional regulator AlpA
MPEPVQLDISNPSGAPIPGLWDIHDLAAFLKVRPETIYHWRKTGGGPTPVRGGKMGRHLRWDPRTVMAWLAEDGDTVTAA